MGHIGSKERFTLQDGKKITARNEDIHYGNVSILVDGERIYYYEIVKVEYLNSNNVVLDIIIPKYPRQEM